MRIPFAVREHWVRHVLRDALRLAGRASPVRASDPRVFVALVPLLYHGALDSDAPVLEPRHGFAQLRRLFRGPGTAGFLRDAAAYAGGGRWAWRRGQVLLATGHPLTARFTPPQAADVPAAMRIALAAISDATMRAASPEALACLALVAYQVLLTIHPFEDGNGRTMRGVYACRVARAGPSAPALLALALMFGGDAARYHEAAWAFRAGEPDLLLHRYFEALEHAEGLLGDALGTTVPFGRISGLLHAVLRQGGGSCVPGGRTLAAAGK